MAREGCKAREVRKVRKAREVREVRKVSRSARCLVAAAACGLTFALTTACVGSAPDRPAHGAEPPAPLPEIKSGPPAPGMVWVSGAWHWDGVRYVWIPGRWESPPNAPG